MATKDAHAPLRRHLPGGSLQLGQKGQNRLSLPRADESLEAFTRTGRTVAGALHCVVRRPHLVTGTRNRYLLAASEFSRPRSMAMRIAWVRERAPNCSRRTSLGRGAYARMTCRIWQAAYSLRASHQHPCRAAPPGLLRHLHAVASSVLLAALRWRPRLRRLAMPYIVMLRDSTHADSTAASLAVDRFRREFDRWLGTRVESAFTAFQLASEAVLKHCQKAKSRWLLSSVPPIKPRRRKGLAAFRTKTRRTSKSS